MARAGECRVASRIRFIQGKQLDRLLTQELSKRRYTLRRGSPVLAVGLMHSTYGLSTGSQMYRMRVSTLRALDSGLRLVVHGDHPGSTGRRRGPPSPRAGPRRAPSTRAGGAWSTVPPAGSRPWRSRPPRAPRRPAARPAWRTNRPGPAAATPRGPRPHHRPRGALGSQGGDIDALALKVRLQGGHDAVQLPRLAQRGHLTQAQQAAVADRERSAQACRTEHRCGRRRARSPPATGTRRTCRPCVAASSSRTRSHYAPSRPSSGGTVAPTTSAGNRQVWHVSPGHKAGHHAGISSTRQTRG
jgi:hypothetical protein